MLFKILICNQNKSHIWQNNCKLYQMQTALNKNIYTMYKVYTIHFW